MGYRVHTCRLLPKRARLPPVVNGGSDATGKWARRGAWLLAFIRVNIDAILVIAAAVVIGYLEIKGNPNQGTVDAVTVAILAVVASTLARERHARQGMGEVVAFIEEQRSDRPYEVQSQTTKWEINDDGTRAVLTRTQRLRFTRNEVSVLDAWSKGAGTIEKCEGAYRLDTPNSGWRTVEASEPFPARMGTKYDFCLGHEKKRGDIMHWRVIREMKNAFPGLQESLTLRIRSPSVKPELEVIWDQSREPTDIRLIQDGNETTIEPSRTPSGGYRVSHEIAGKVGTAATIAWHW